MPTSLQIQINGQPRSFDAADPTPLDRLLSFLELRGDRIAVEHNDEIVPRDLWSQVQVHSGDRLEIVHFVGGGSPDTSGPESGVSKTTKPQQKVSSLKLIFKNLTAIFTSNVISVLTELLQPAIFLRSYGTVVYADWIVLSSAVSYLSTLNFGLQTFVNQDLAVRYNRGEHEGFHLQQSTALRALLGITMIAAVGCLCIFFIPVERLLNLSISHFAASLALYFIALQVIVGALVFSYFTGAFMGVGLAHRGNNWQNAQRFGNAALLCILALMRQPLNVLAFGQFAWYTVMLVVVIADLKRKAPDIFPTLRYWDRPTLIAMLKPSAYFGLLYWANFLGYELPLILLRKLAGPTAVVVFSLGRKVFSFGRQVLTGLTQSLGPEITRTYGQNEWPKLYRLYDYSERVIFALIASVNIPLFLFSPILLQLWLHKSGLFNLNTFLLLGMTATVICVKEHKIQFQYSTNTHEALARVMFFGYLSMCVVSVATIHYFGLPGMVATWLATEVYMTFAIVHLNKQLFASYEKLTSGYITKLSILCLAGFAVAYAILWNADVTAKTLTYRITICALESIIVITAAWYLFHIKELSAYLQQKLQAKFRPAKA